MTKIAEQIKAAHRALDAECDGARDRDRKPWEPDAMDPETARRLETAMDYFIAERDGRVAPAHDGGRMK